MLIENNSRNSISQLIFRYLSHIRPKYIYLATWLHICIYTRIRLLSTSKPLPWPRPHHAVQGKRRQPRSMDAPEGSNGPRTRVLDREISPVPRDKILRFASGKGWLCLEGYKGSSRRSGPYRLDRISAWEGVSGDSGHSESALYVSCSVDSSLTTTGCGLSNVSWQ